MHKHCITFRAFIQKYQNDIYIYLTRITICDIIYTSPIPTHRVAYNSFTGERSFATYPLPNSREVIIMTDAAQIYKDMNAEQQVYASWLLDVAKALQIIINANKLIGLSKEQQTDGKGVNA